MNPLPGECWLELPESAGKYLVSNMGRACLAANKRLLTPYLQKQGNPASCQGRLRVKTTQMIAGKRYIKYVYLAKQVAAMFLPNPSGEKLVRFLDGDPTNCRVSNLVWGYGATPHELGRGFAEIGRVEVPAIPEGITKYVLRRDASALNSAFTALLPVATKAIRGRLWKLKYQFEHYEVDDIVQEALMKAKTGIDRGMLRHAGNIEGWLDRIVRNEANMYVKERRIKDD